MVLFWAIISINTLFSLLIKTKMIPVGILTAAATSSFTFLLDEYPGAVAAYSFRKLRSTYTGFCCQTYDSTNGLVNVGFVNNYVDLTTLQNLGADCFVVNWYDQSGNGNNMFRASSQGGKIKIANVIQKINNKVTINFNGQNSSSTGGSIPLKDGFSNFTVSKVDTSTQTAFLFSKQGFTDVGFALSQNSNEFGLQKVGIEWMIKKSTKGPTTYTLFTSYYDGANGGFKTNGTIQATGTYAKSNLTNTTFLSIPSDSSTPNNYANITESVFYLNNQLANQSGIEANINSFYTIY